MQSNMEKGWSCEMCPLLCETTFIILATTFRLVNSADEHDS